MTQPTTPAPRTRKLTEGQWALIAAVVTVAGGLLLVWYQTSGASRKSQALLERFQATVRDTDELRKAVLRPFEGRWDYSMEWDTYFDVDSVKETDNKAGQFFGVGVAHFEWINERYRVLLGYENKTRAGDVLSVSFNTGEVNADADGHVDQGTKITMNYLYRMGVEDYDLNGKVVSTTQTTERGYHYTIETVELDETGRGTKIVARYELDHSKGQVILTRRD